MQVEICASDDYDTIARLHAVIHELGGRGEGDDPDEPFGTGAHRFRFGRDVLTVYADAWLVDVSGPDGLVEQVLAALAG